MNRSPPIDVGSTAGGWIRAFIVLCGRKPYFPGDVPPMPYDPQQAPPLFHIDIVSSATDASSKPRDNQADVLVALLQRLVLGQERQNKLLDEILQQTNAMARQRQFELSQWKQANPDLARRCRRAAETLNRVQNEFLETLTDEVIDSEDSLLDGDFMLQEFVDRFGPRLVHLNGVLQMLSQLSYAPDNAGTPPRPAG